MHLRDRLIRIKEEGQLVGLSFVGVPHPHLSRILRVGTDYLEFEVCTPDGAFLSQHLMPLQLLTGVVLASVERQRHTLEGLYRRELEEGDPPGRSI